MTNYLDQRCQVPTTNSMLNLIGLNIVLFKDTIFLQRSLIVNLRPKTTNKGVNAKWFHLFLYSIAFRFLPFSNLKMDLIPNSYSQNGPNTKFLFRSRLPRHDPICLTNENSGTSDLSLQLQH